LIWPSFTLLDAALPPNTDLCTALSLHFFQTVTTRANEQTEEIDFRKFFNRDVDLFRGTLRTLLLMIFDGRAEIGVVFHGSIDKPDAFIF
jgi:hypothetical protein